LQHNEALSRLISSRTANSGDFYRIMSTAISCYNVSGNAVIARPSSTPAAAAAECASRITPCKRDVDGVRRTHDRLMSRRLSNYAIASPVLVTPNRPSYCLPRALLYFNQSIPSDRMIRRHYSSAVRSDASPPQPGCKSVKILRPSGSISHETFQLPHLVSYSPRSATHGLQADN